MEEKQTENKFLKRLKWFFFSFIWLAVLMFAIDLGTKLWIVNYFKTHNEPIVIFSKNFLTLEYITNSKSAFGLGLNQALTHRIIFIIIAMVGAGIAIFFFVKKFKEINGIVKASLMLITTGALGNLVDRIFYTKSFLISDYLISQFENGAADIHDGAVVDWINFTFLPDIWYYPFNIADSCVVVGTIMLIVYLIVEEIRLAAKNRKQEVKEEEGKVLSQEEKRRLIEEEKEESAVQPVEEEKASTKEE